jgi:hypothetical protein
MSGFGISTGGDVACAGSEQEKFAADVQSR